MLYAVIGDIHGNLQALNAVLDDVEQMGAERIVCTGDVVGYGADPQECLETVRSLDVVTVAGNHDWAVLGKIDIEYFNADARDSVEWSRGKLTDDGLIYLNDLPLVRTLDDMTLVHSSPFLPEYFEYLQTQYDVVLAFNHMQNKVCFIGHSHVPVIFLAAEPVDCFLRPEFKLGINDRAVINVGSVGQPRDLDPRACYVLYDTGEQKISFRRITYDVQEASERMVRAGLPATNAARIVLGR